MEAIRKKDMIIRQMIDTEFKPEIVERETVNLSLFDSLPISSIADLGPSFLPLITSVQNLSSQLLGSVNSSGEMLCKVTLPKGATSLAKRRNGLGCIGASFDNNNRLVGQATISPISPSNSLGSESGSVASKMNPYMIVIAAAIMNINMKLNDLKRGQDSLMDFLEQKEKAILEGNLNFLSDILNNYKFNWNNEKYINANHIKVLDIIQESEQGIKLFKNQVQSVIKEDSLFHTTKKVSKSVNDLLARFDDYRLSVYMYAFSSYVNVLLLENFEQEFLRRIAEKISNYALEYRGVYSDVYAALERYNKRSVRSIASRGAAGVTKVLGKTVEKIPKLGDTQIDENLIATSERILDFDIDTNERMARTIVNCQKVDISPFVDNINRISYLYNTPLTILVSYDRVYIEEKH